MLSSVSMAVILTDFADALSIVIPGQIFVFSTTLRLPWVRMTSGHLDIELVRRMFCDMVKYRIQKKQIVTIISSPHFFPFLSEHRVYYIL